MMVARFRLLALTLPVKHRQYIPSELVRLNRSPNRLEGMAAKGPSNEPRQMSN